MKKALLVLLVIAALFVAAPSASNAQCPTLSAGFVPSFGVAPVFVPSFAIDPFAAARFQAGLDFQRALARSAAFNSGFGGNFQQFNFGRRFGGFQLNQGGFGGGFGGSQQIDFFQGPFGGKRLRVRQF